MPSIKRCVTSQVWAIRCNVVLPAPDRPIMDAWRIKGLPISNTVDSGVRRINGELSRGTSVRNILSHG